MGCASSKENKSPQQRSQAKSDNNEESDPAPEPSKSDAQAASSSRTEQSDKKAESKVVMPQPRFAAKNSSLSAPLSGKSYHSNPSILSNDGSSLSGSTKKKGTSNAKGNSLVSGLETYTVSTLTGANLTGKSTVPTRSALTGTSSVIMNESSLTGSTLGSQGFTPVGMSGNESGISGSSGSKTTKTSKVNASSSGKSKAVIGGGTGGSSIGSSIVSKEVISATSYVSNASSACSPNSSSSTKDQKAKPAGSRVDKSTSKKSKSTSSSSKANNSKSKNSSVSNKSKK